MLRMSMQEVPRASAARRTRSLHSGSNASSPNVHSAVISASTCALSAARASAARVFPTISSVTARSMWRISTVTSAYSGRMPKRFGQSCMREAEVRPTGS